MVAWNPNVRGPPQKSAADPLHTLATHLATRYGKDGMQKHSLSYGKNDWSICKMYWLIVCCFKSHSRLVCKMYWLLENILSLWEVTDYTEEELPKCSALRPLSRERLLSCLTCSDTGSRFFFRYYSKCQTVAFLRQARGETKIFIYIYPPRSNFVSAERMVKFCFLKTVIGIWWRYKYEKLNT